MSADPTSRAAPLPAASRCSGSRDASARRRALPGSARRGRICAGRRRARPFRFPADHGPHPDFRIEWWYVTANLADAGGAAYGAQWTLFRQALAPGAQQEGWANQQIWMGACRGDPRRHPSLQRNLCARRRRPGRRRGKAVRGLDRLLGRCAALEAFDANDHLAARPHRIGQGFHLRAASRGRPSAGAAGRRRLQPEIRARAGILLLQPAVLQARGRSPSTTSPPMSPARPGWTGNGAASRSRRTRPAGTGSRCILPPAKS